MHVTVFLCASARGISRTTSAAQVAVKPKVAPIVEKKYHMRPTQELYTEKAPVFYKERSIKVHACKELYAEWKLSKPGWQEVSPNGFDLDVPYIHTGMDRGRKSGPTVVALHGSPGSHRDFDGLIPAMDNIGANVIVPTFPDLKFSMKTQNYWHSLEEKVDLLEKYLLTLDINEVDVLLCHSSSMYSALQVALGSKIKINSMVFFAPSGCRQLTQLSPLPLFHWYNMQFRKPYLQKILMSFAVAIIKAYSKPSTDTIGTVTSMVTMVQSKYDDAEPWCKELHTRGIPSLLLYGKRDKLIDVAISEEMAAFIGNPHKDTYYLYKGNDDTEATMAVEGTSDYELPEVVCFERGSHFGFRKFPETYNYHVGNFLQRHIREKLNK